MSTLKTHQYGLALHTSSPQLGIALSNFTDNSRCQTWDLDRDLSNYLHQYLAEFLKPQTWQDIAFLAVAKGPGSFTSTRIGVVTARTLAQQLDIPLFGISSLAALAWSKREYYQNRAIAVQMPATRGQVYVAIYEANASLITHLSDTVMTPEAWQQTLTNLTIPYQILEAPTHLGITVTSVLELAYQDWKAEKRPQWQEILPFYGVSTVDSVPKI